jgi:predicted aspartyl protease
MTRSEPAAHSLGGMSKCLLSKRAACCVLCTLALALVFTNLARAQEPDPEEQLLQAGANGETAPLEAAERRFSDPARRKLARLEIAASRLDLAAVRQALHEYVASADSDHRHQAYAWSAAAGAFFSVGHYAEAYDAAQHWKSALPAGAAGAAELQDAENLESIAHPLAAAPRQTVASSQPLKTPMLIDAVGLKRSSLTINGIIAEGVLDTGANLSTVTASMAARLHLRMLKVKATVGSSTQAAVNTQLGIADRLELAGVSLRNVVFLVMPDEQLQVPVPGYRLDLIIGFPVFRAMSAVRFDGNSAFTPLGSSAAAQRGSQTRFDGSNILISAQINGEETALQLDTGAAQTALSGVFAKAHPEIVSQLKVTDAHVAGAGGTVSTKVANWENVRIAIGDRLATLALLQIDADPGAGIGKYPGVIGQDLLNQFSSFEIDFIHRRFELGMPVKDGT